jgi:hypothetical protein
VGPLDRNPLYVAGFLLFLIVPQGHALAQQFRLGYRPFGQAPQRVTLSWDMFSTAISRCDVRWDPPLNAEGRPLARLHDSGTALEWDPVYDRVEDYMHAAEYGCVYGRPHTTATLQCFTFEGEAVKNVFRCR